MNSRAAILQRLGRDERQPAARSFTQQAESNPVTEELIEHFSALANDTQMTVEQVLNRAAVPAAVTAYLTGASLGTDIVVQPELIDNSRHWINTDLSIDRTEVFDDNDVYVGAGLAVVANCGALVIRSGSGQSLKSEFLARTHIAVVNIEHVMPNLGALWRYLHASFPDRLPREFCLVTGPSRTADLGVPAKLGAHGPERVHVILVA